MDRQYTIAVQHDYSFLDNTRQVNRFVDLGLLVPVRGGAYHELVEVSFPYARPAVRTFVERLSAQYFSACREKLVVTSLTRPTGRQPRNASDQSVHPAGMAVDLRISRAPKCRSWLERTLLSLEKTGVLDATRERNPAHYHIAIFPQQYLAYVARLQSGTRLASNATTPTADAPVQAASAVVTTPTDDAADAGLENGASVEQTTPDVTGTIDYRVNRGDTLWSIARRHGTSVQELKQLNGLRTARIAAGQVLQIPTGQ